MCLRFLLLGFILEIKKNIQQLETLLSQFPCLNLFFFMILKVLCRGQVLRLA